MGAATSTLGSNVGGTMGTIGDILPASLDPAGIFHPGGGAGAPPELANVQQGTSVDDVKNAQMGVGNSLQSQQALLQALQGQGGLNQQNSLANQYAQANGIGTQNSAIQGLQGTAGMYQNIAQGKGPNPAQAMLNQQTGQNVANQAALMASQRGAGANAGLLARQAAQQGGALQQQAVGQGATMQANQQLNALQGLSGTQQAIGGLGSTQAAAQQALANQVAGQQIGGTNAMTQANLANAGQLQNALQGVNTANVASQGSVNAANAGLAQQAAANKAGILGGIMNAGGAAMGSSSKKAPAAEGAAGGMVHMADGGIPMEQSSVSQPTGPQSSFGKYLTGWQTDSPDNSNAAPMAVEKAAPATQAPSGLGEIASIASLVAARGGLATTGGHVAAGKPSQKAEKGGNSYDNDKVPAMLSEGEIVLPRSITQSADPVAAAADFVRKTLHERSQAKTHFKDGGEAKKEEENEDDEIVDAIEKEDDNSEAGVPPVVSAGPTAAPPVAPPPAIPQAPVAAPAAASVPLDASSPAKAAPATPPPVAPAQAAPMEVPISGAATVPQSNTPPAAEVEKTPEQKAKEKTHQNMQVYDDLRYNRIEPKTVSDLIGEKSTTGKIGTIFGLLLSGAGSGLSKQPNLLLEMMNKEIERDVDAQKQNQENKRSWFTAGLEQLQTFADTNLTNAQAKKTGAEADMAKFNNQQAGVTNFEATNEALNNTTMGVMSNLQQVIDHMPAGPQKDAYQNVFDTKAVPYFLDIMERRNLETEQKKKLLNTLPMTKSNPPPKKEVDAGTKFDSVNENKLNAMIQKGKFAPNAPDAIDPRWVPAIDEEKKSLVGVRNQYANYAEGFKKLNQMKSAGQIAGLEALPAVGTAVGAAAGAVGSGGVASGLAAGIGNMVGSKAIGGLRKIFERDRDIQVESFKAHLPVSMSDAKKDALAEASFPSWQDDDKSAREAFHKGTQYFESSEGEVAPQLRRAGVKYDMPKYAYPTHKAESKYSSSKKKDEKEPSEREVKKEELPKEEDGILKQMFWPKESRGK